MNEAASFVFFAASLSLESSDSGGKRGSGKSGMVACAAGPSCLFRLPPVLSAAFYAAYGFTGAFGRNLCKFTFPQRRRNLRKSLLLTTRPTGVKRAKKWLR